MSKRMDQGDRELAVTMAEVGGGTRLGMLITTSGGVGDEEGRRGGNMAELN